MILLLVGDATSLDVLVRGGLGVRQKTAGRCLASRMVMLTLALLLQPPLTPRRTARTACHVSMRGGVDVYRRGDDGGGAIDERRVEELVATRSALRRARDFRGADDVLAQINRMGVSVWDRERVWMVGSAPPRREQGGSSPSSMLQSKSARIFVTNLPYEIEWQQLRDHFARSGFRVVFARINTDSRTGEQRGNGVVQFETAAEASTALQEMDGTVLMGRRLGCRVDVRWQEHAEESDGDEQERTRPEKPQAWQGKAWTRAAGTLDDSAEMAAIDPAEILALLERRDAAREVRDFSTADALLDELAGLGVSVDDARRQKRWWLGKRVDEPARPATNERGSKASPRGAADARRRAWYNNPPQD